MSLQYPTIRIHPSGMQFAADNVGGMLVMLALLGVAGYDGLVTEQMKIWLLPHLPFNGALPGTLPG